MIQASILPSIFNVMKSPFLASKQSLFHRIFKSGRLSSIMYKAVSFFSCLTVPVRHLWEITRNKFLTCLKEIAIKQPKYSYQTAPRSKKSKLYLIDKVRINLWDSSFLRKAIEYWESAEITDNYKDGGCGTRRLSQQTKDSLALESSILLTPLPKG